MSTALQLILAIASLLAAVWIGMRITRHHNREQFRNDDDQGMQ